MARSFNGTTEYLRRDASALAADPTTVYPFTMAAWAKPVDAIANGSIIWLGDSTLSDAQFYIGMRGSANPTKAAAADYHTTFAAALSTQDYTPGQWHHVLGLFLNQDWRTVYLDGKPGVPNTTHANRVGAVNNRTSIGMFDRSGPTAFFAGEIAHPAIWRVALTDEQIKRLAAGWSPELISPEALVMYLTLEGNDMRSQYVNEELGHGTIQYLSGTSSVIGTTPTPDPNVLKVKPVLLGQRW
jgi:hypothetical protein